MPAARTPRLASSLLAAGLAIGGCGGGGHAASAGAAPTTIAAASRGGPVPPRTRATSVTFISPDSAFVLGTAPCGHPPCSVILRTRDRGRSWRGLPAPREAVGQFAQRGLWGLRFADARNGYAYGKGFWETADGGRSWQRRAGPAPIVLALEAVQARELVAVSASCLPGQTSCRRGLRLYTRPVSSGTWTVAAKTRTYSTDASIAVHGPAVTAVVGTRLYASRDGGRTFARERAPCAAPGISYGTAVADDGAHAYLVCSGLGGAGSITKYVFRGRGSSWARVGSPPTPGAEQGLSAGSDGAVVVAATGGASWLYRSSDGGDTWRTVVTENDGGQGWADLGFTTRRDGVVIHGPAMRDRTGGGWPGRLLLTDDAGRTWHRVRFRAGG
jgi:photosystem II stability/assembly factor-like uncharacterized protein